MSITGSRKLVLDRYWVIFGFAKFLEHFNRSLLKVMPFYYLCKTFVILWLMMPETKGTQIIQSVVLSGVVGSIDKLSGKKPTIKDALPAAPAVETKPRRSFTSFGHRGTL
jgi:hypothetical protein